MRPTWLFNFANFFNFSILSVFMYLFLKFNLAPGMVIDKFLVNYSAKLRVTASIKSGSFLLCETNFSTVAENHTISI